MTDLPKDLLKTLKKQNVLLVCYNGRWQSVCPLHGIEVDLNNDGSALLTLLESSEEDIKLLTFNDAPVSPAKLEIHAGAENNLIFEYQGTGENEQKLEIDIKLSEGSSLKCYYLQQAAADLRTATSVTLEKAANFKLVNLILSGKKITNSLSLKLAGEAAKSELYGLIKANNDQEISNQIEVTHLVPQCISKALYKGVLDNKAQTKFDGVINVVPHAQKTEATQTVKSLLLSNEAVSKASPQLKIFADDVKCSHGATVGQLDDEALFYLQSRGIPESIAKEMLIGAFAGEIIQQIESSDLRTRIITEL